ncbi:hypothetical protein MASR2M15_29810 [Anaerolineales bacterium]
MALYLNQVYFGHLAYGLEAAARSYFNKTGPPIILGECALLARWYRIKYMIIAITRIAKPATITLDLMVKNQMIDAEQAQQAKQDDLQFRGGALHD